METKKKFSKVTIIKIIIAITIIVIVSIGMSIGVTMIKRSISKPDIISTASLEKIINVNDLSTFEAVYNGIATVYNEEKVDKQGNKKVNYYVSYEAKVKAGIDVTEVDIDVDEENQKIIISMPEVKITDINVDITSLDYIIENKKLDTKTISQEAYNKCIEDVSNETSKEQAIYSLAQENAKNILIALIEPFVKQVNDQYVLEIVEGDF